MSVHYNIWESPISLLPSQLSYFLEPTLLPGFSWVGQRERSFQPQSDDTQHERWSLLLLPQKEKKILPPHRGYSLAWRRAVSGIMASETSSFHIRAFGWALAGVWRAKLCWKQCSEDTLLRPDCFNPDLSICGIHDVNTGSQSSSNFKKWVLEAFSRCTFWSS